MGKKETMRIESLQNVACFEIDFCRFFFCFSIFFNRERERQSKYIFAHSFIQSLSCYPQNVAHKAFEHIEIVQIISRETVELVQKHDGTQLGTAWQATNPIQEQID